MPVHKRHDHTKASWFYKFDAPGSTRRHRIIVKKTGFKTKQEAIAAEAARRLEVQREHELAAAGRVAGTLPETLGALLNEFFTQHGEKLAPKTLERYRESAAYLDAALLAMPFEQVTPLHLNREWDRLLKCGGHSRNGSPRPMKAKTVRNIAGVVSAAYGRAIRWGLVERNPVEHSEPPIPQKHKGAALTPAQEDLLRDSASGPWCLGVFIEMCAATGARRGEVLALRWSDIEGGRATIARSLTQTRKILEFKTTKTDNIRVVGLPASALDALEIHRKRQDVYRAQFGPDYRADLDLIFANPDGTPLRPDSVSSTVSLLFKRLKLPKPKGVALHLLRHSHGSQMLAGGVPLQVVSERLGHSSVRVTADVYSHALHGADDAAVRAWEEYRRKAGNERVVPGGPHKTVTHLKNGSANGNRTRI